jgi:phospholipase/lecithinase/hemolysin
MNRLLVAVGGSIEPWGKMPSHRLILCALIALLPQCAMAGYTRMVIFGDSITSEGNASPPPAGYYMERNSNGPVWVEDLATLVTPHLPAPAKSSGAGPNNTNFAYSGARATGMDAGGAPDLAAQVNQYLQRASSPAGELFVIDAGSVDIFGGATNTTAIAGAVVTQVNRLAALGGKSFLVGNVYPLGSSPALRGRSNATRVNDLVTQFNSTLKLDIEALRPTLGGDVRIDIVDFHALYADALGHPATYGLTNVTQGAFDFGARDPDHYLWWDGVHPTRVSHQFMAAEAAKVLAAPEPSALALLLVPILSLIVRPRRGDRSTTSPIIFPGGL